MQKRFLKWKAIVILQIKLKNIVIIIDYEFEKQRLLKCSSNRLFLEFTYIILAHKEKW